MLTPYTELSTNFVYFLNSENRKPKIDLRLQEDWYTGAESASRGPGNPAGSIVKLSKQLKKRVYTRLEEFCSTANHCEDQESYDKIFYEYCEKVVSEIIDSQEGILYSFGRAQKILNILMKYQSTYHFGGFPRENLFLMENIEAVTPFLHAPVDRFTFAHIAKFKECQHLVQSGRFLLSWKRDLDQQRYKQIQNWLRSKSSKDGYDHPLHYEASLIWNEAELAD